VDSAKLEVLRMQAEKTGETPATLQRMPDLYDDAAPFWLAFWHLHASRNMNGVIPVSEVAAWLDLHRIDDLDERARTARLIRAMDTEYLAWREAQKGGKHG